MLRRDIVLIARQTDRFPYAWLLTQDSKATALTRLLFAMRPWYRQRAAPARRGARRFGDRSDQRSHAPGRCSACSTRRRATPTSHAAPEWVRRNVPWLARLWGDGLIRSQPLAVSQEVLEWSRSDPDGLLAAARYIAAKQPVEEDSNARRLMQLLDERAESQRPAALLHRRAAPCPARGLGRSHPDLECALRRDRARAACAMATPTPRRSAAISIETFPIP